MPSGREAEPWSSLGERGYPAIVAHAAGNSLELVEDALTGKADFVEVDVWYRKRRFEARHERRLGIIPVLFEKWYLSFAPSLPFTLPALIDGLDGRGGILLDLKTSQREAADAIAEILEKTPGHTPISASSAWWPALRRLHDRLPEIPLFYSIDSRAQLDLFRSILRRDHRPAGISCRETLLTRRVICEMHERGLKVLAWTVDDLERAAELASWGVDGITTHMVTETHALLTQGT